MGICTKFLDLWDAKIEKNIHERKIITHKTVFTWFGNLPMSTELQGFHYFQGKNTECGSTIFFSLKKGHKKPNLQNNSFYILRTEFIIGYKNRPKIFFPRMLPPNPQGGLSMSVMAWAYHPKPLLHRLSLRKSPIKKL